MRAIILTRCRLRLRVDQGHGMSVRARGSRVITKTRGKECAFVGAFQNCAPASEMSAFGR